MMSKLASKTLLGALVVMAAMVVSTTGIYADGATKTVCTTAYGDVTNCDEVTDEQVVHEVVDTGISGVVLAAAGLFGLGAVLVYRDKLNLHLTK